MAGNCSVCGQSVSNASTFCEHCGARVKGQRRGAAVGNVVGAVCLGIICLPLGASALLGLLDTIRTPLDDGLLVPTVIGYAAVLWVSALGILRIAKLLKQGK